MSMATAYNRSTGGRFGIRIGIDLPEAWHHDTRWASYPVLFNPFALMAINNSLDEVQKYTICSSDPIFSCLEDCHNLATNPRSISDNGRSVLYSDSLSKLHIIPTDYDLGQHIQGFGCIVTALTRIRQIVAKVTFHQLFSRSSSVGRVINNSLLSYRQAHDIGELG
jgi:hypothetical protein